LKVAVVGHHEVDSRFFLLRFNSKSQKTFWHEVWVWI
jgi:hypothetical protein